MALDFVLPPELEAHEPPEARGLARDDVRLLVSYRANDHIVHARFRDLPDFLDAGDLLVVNNSATLPAALVGKRADGSEMALHLSTQRTDDIWVAEPRHATVEAGEVAELPGGGRVTFLAPYRVSTRLWTARLELPVDPLSYLKEWGRPIRYPYVLGDWPLEMYQNVYARVPGSAEMPSAGRAFSLAVLDALANKGVERCAITLHTGVASLEQPEHPHEEWFEVSEETADAINEHRQSGRIVAVGTTVVRALESAVDESGRVTPASGWTDLVIIPEHRIRSVQGLVTGFHEPKASHFGILAAFAGREHLVVAYGAALDNGYLWHEFGDLHLIL